MTLLFDVSNNVFIAPSVLDLDASITWVATIVAFSNSLLDLVVFGRSVAKHISSEFKSDGKTPQSNNNSENKCLDRFDKIRYANGDVSVADIRLRMQKSHLVNQLHYINKKQRRERKKSL